MWVLNVRSSKDGLKEYTLAEGRTVMGRSSSNKIMLHGDMVSRLHCELFWNKDENSLLIKDLDSKNGTYLNRKRLGHAREVENGDQIRIGLSVIDVSERNTRQLPKSDRLVLHTTSLTDAIALQSFEHHTILLKDVAEQLNTVANVDLAIDRVTALTKGVLGADRCMIFLEKDFPKLKALGYPSSLTNPVITDRQIVLVTEARKDAKLGQSAILQSVNSALCVPIIVDDSVKAIFYLDKLSEIAKPFSQIESELAVGIGHQFAMTLQRLALESKMLYEAMHDTTTLLPNQKTFIERLRSISDGSEMLGEESFAVVALNIDKFQVINDIYGREIGDQLLSACADRIREDLAQDHYAARIDGAAFAIIVPGISGEEGAEQYIESLHHKISKPFDITRPGISLTAGIGASLSKMGYENPEDLLRDAEAAMYVAKKNGKGASAIFNQEMRDQAVSRFALESDLRIALQEKNILVHYQPIVSLRNGQIAGFEALARWKSKTGQRIPTSEFIKLAEGTQLIFEIDMLVLKSACKQLAAWQKNYSFNPALTVSVNLSSRQFSEKDLVSQVKKTLTDSDLPAAQLHLELTERSVMDEGETAVGRLKELRALGVRISIDDFGTGYSSLSMLQNFPMDTIKLDRSFIRANSWEIVEMVTKLGQKLGLAVIAEGIESKEALAKLKIIECDFAQGYLFSRPEHPERVEKFFSERLTW